MTDLIKDERNPMSRMIPLACNYGQTPYINPTRNHAGIATMAHGGGQFRSGGGLATIVGGSLCGFVGVEFYQSTP